jgi:hypothetical protein
MILYILLSFLIFIGILNLVFIFVLGSFVVRLRERLDNIFSDLLEMFTETSGETSDSQSFESEFKTWDQKYEEEIEKIQKSLKSNSGLVDLSDPIPFSKQSD